MRLIRLQFAKKGEMEAQIRKAKITFKAGAEEDFEANRNKKLKSRQACAKEKDRR